MPLVQLCRIAAGAHPADAAQGYDEVSGTHLDMGAFVSLAPEAGEAPLRIVHWSRLMPGDRSGDEGTPGYEMGDVSGAAHHGGGMRPATFQRVDADHNGRIDHREVRAWLARIMGGDPGDADRLFSWYLSATPEERAALPDDLRSQLAADGADVDIDGTIGDICGALGAVRGRTPRPAAHHVLAARHRHRQQQPQGGGSSECAEEAQAEMEAEAKAEDAAGVMEGGRGAVRRAPVRRITRPKRHHKKHDQEQQQGGDGGGGDEQQPQAAPEQPEPAQDEEPEEKEAEVEGTGAVRRPLMLPAGPVDPSAPSVEDYDDAGEADLAAADLAAVEGFWSDLWGASPAAEHTFQDLTASWAALRRVPGVEKTPGWKGNSVAWEEFSRAYRAGDNSSPQCNGDCEAGLNAQVITLQTMRDDLAKVAPGWIKTIPAQISLTDAKGAVFKVAEKIDEKINERAKLSWWARLLAGDLPRWQYAALTAGGITAGVAVARVAFGGLASGRRSE